MKPPRMCVCMHATCSHACPPPCVPVTGREQRPTPHARARTHTYTHSVVLCTGYGAGAAPHTTSLHTCAHALTHTHTRARAHTHTVCFLVLALGCSSTSHNRWRVQGARPHTPTSALPTQNLQCAKFAACILIYIMLMNQQYAALYTDWFSSNSHSCWGACSQFARTYTY